MNNVIMRKIVLTEDWQPLSDVRLIGSITVSTAPTNQAVVLFRSVDEPQHEVPWVAGEWHDFANIDLSQLEAKAASSASAGDIVTLVGGSW